MKCQSAANKISALRRIRTFVSLKTAKSLCNVYIFSNFNYCPLIWMNFVKRNNDKIEKIQRRALSVYHNYNSDIYELLSIDKGVTFHIKFIFKLVEEIFKTVHKQNPSFLHEIFTVKQKSRDIILDLVSNLPYHQQRRKIWNTVLKLYRLSFMGSPSKRCETVYNF